MTAKASTPYQFPLGEDGKPYGNMESICWNLQEQGLSGTVADNAPKDFPEEIRDVVIKYNLLARQLDAYIEDYAEKHNIDTE